MLQSLNLSVYSQAKMLGGMCVGKVRVLVVCVFLQPFALMYPKAPILKVLYQSATKTLAASQQCVKNSGGKSLILGREGKA
jgi:hypothetical protein